MQNWNIIATNPLAHAQAIITMVAEPASENGTEQQRPLPSYMRVERLREGIVQSDYVRIHLIK
jgi:hypothetical protein